MKKDLKIVCSAFVEWMWDSDNEARTLGEEVITALVLKGEYSTSVKKRMKNVDYLPFRVAYEDLWEMEEFEYCEDEEIYDLENYNLILVDVNGKPM